MGHSQAATANGEKKAPCPAHAPHGGTALFSRLPGCALLFLTLFLSACGHAASPPSVKLALEGPPLFIRAVLEPAGNAGAGNSGTQFGGYMERSCMAGVGHLTLSDLQSGFFCEGEMDSLPSEKGRLHAELLCSDGRSLNILLRNLGPDQGIGIGRLDGDTGTLELFYHPSEGEAMRRLTSFRAELTEARDSRGGAAQTEE